MAGRRNQNAALRKPEILEGYYQILIEEGLEGASVSKIAKRLDIHPSLIFHYFQNKENLQFELIDLMIDKFKSQELLVFDHIQDDEARFEALLDLIFSERWSRTVDPGVHFGFYYQSFRDVGTLKRLKDMFNWLKDYLRTQIAYFNRAGLIRVQDEDRAAEYMVTLMEGLEFHSQFLRDDKPFADFALTAKQSVRVMLTEGYL